jgi:mycofactocin glycosyltransferase
VSGALPDGFGIVLDRAASLSSQRRTILGGSPRRLLRLSPAAMQRLRSWIAGEPIAGAADGRLARRLIDAGIAHPLPVGGPRTEEVTIVVPVRDRESELARCLTALAGAATTLIVDDGSQDAARIAAIARDHGARLVRHAQPRGPAAARNTGIRMTETSIVVFVDSDCVAQPGWLERVMPHFADPTVAAVAPRIVALDPGDGGWVARYEAVRSPLDLGAVAGRVAPQTRISYVPAAALAVRRTAAGHGFAEAMAVGEDVDFVWSLHARGWRMRYEPAARVAHEHRTTFPAWLRRRFEYGLSAAPLARRHPRGVAPVVVPLWSAAVWAMVVAARPRTGLAVIVLTGFRLRRRLSRIPGSGAVVIRVVASGTLGAGSLLAAAVTRAWLPPVGIVALRRAAVRRWLLVAWLLPSAAEWWRRRPRLDPCRYALARLLDDAAYCFGVWVGCARARVLDPLIPRSSAHAFEDRGRRRPGR